MYGTLRTCRYMPANARLNGFVGTAGTYTLGRSWLLEPERFPLVDLNL